MRVKYLPEAPPRVGDYIAAGDDETGALAIPINGPPASVPRLSRVHARSSGFDADPAKPEIDLAYHGGARRNDTPAALIVGLTITGVAAWWVAEILFNLIRDWSR